MVKGTHGKRHPPSAGRGNLAGLIQAFLDSLYLIIRISAFFRLEVPGPRTPEAGPHPSASPSRPVDTPSMQMNVPAQSAPGGGAARSEGTCGRWAPLAVPLLRIRARVSEGPG